MHSGTTAISAHRRDSDGGFETAAASGAEYVEIDVRRTGDGELVAHHAPQIAGMPLARCSYDRIGAVTGRPVPLVRDALKVIAGRSLGHLDLKETGSEYEAVALALDLLGPGNFVVTTKLPGSISLIKKAFPEVRTALSVGRGLRERGAVRDLSPLALVRACGADMVAMNHRLARVGVLRRCARAGLPAMVWTVNEGPHMRRFLNDPRVEIMVTDHPVQALALRFPR